MFLILFAQKKDVCINSDYLELIMIGSQRVEQDTFEKKLIN